MATSDETTTATPTKAPKKKAPKKAATKKAAGASGVKKAKKGARRDLPGQKVMPHGPKKISELESAGQSYAECEVAMERAKKKLKNAEGAMFDLLKKKKCRTYTVAGNEFYRKSNGESLGVRKAKQ